MSKIKTTMKNITERYSKVWRCGYCDLQYIMRGIDPTYYNCGIYGWNCDIYTTEAGAITTGYRNMRGERIPSEIIKEYTEKADEIINNGGFDYNKIQAGLDVIRSDFFRTLNNL